MGLVERVTGERLDQVEYLNGHFLFIALSLGSSHEINPLFGHQGSDLLSHCFPHDICPAQGVTGELLQDQQHLVLIDDYTVGLVQQFFETGMGIGDGRAAMLRIDEGLDIFHGTWAVQGDHRRDIAKVGGLQFPDVALHPCAFKLEQVIGVAR